MFAWFSGVLFLKYTYRRICTITEERLADIRHRARMELPRPDKTARLTLKLIYFPVTVTAVKLRGKAGVRLVTQSLS